MKPTPLLVLATLASLGRAQGSASPVLPTDLRVPWHERADADGATSPDLWAAGSGYKARFGDGFELFPVLGASAPKNLPLRWRTEDARAGGTSLRTAGRTPRIAHDAFVVAFDHGQVTEKYEVRADGVEQTFVVAARPETAGPIVVTGRIESELVAPAFEGHGELVFTTRDGRATLRYGAAQAFDADGATIAVTTTYADGLLRLTVPAEFAAAAHYPLTIDPLVAAVSVSTGAGVVEHVAIGAFPNATGRNTMIAVTRASSVSDTDLFLYACNGNYSNPLLVYSDVTSSWSTSHPHIAACEGAGRWVLAFQRDFVNPDQSTVRTYVHDLNNTVFSSGSEVTATLNVGNTHRYVQVGGATGSGGKKALVVWQTDVTTTQQNTNSSDIYGRVLDVTTKTFTGPAFVLHVSTTGNRDREFPAVSRMAADTGSWIVAWQEYDLAIPGDDWDLKAARVTQAGALVGEAVLDFGKASFHSVVPKVAGQAGRYAVSWTDTTTTTGTAGQNLYARRFDWSDAATAPTLNTIRTVDSLASSSLGEFENAGIAYDTTSTSHWAVAYRLIHRSVSGAIRVARLGSTAGVVERVTGFTNGGVQLHSDITFHATGAEEFFQTVFKADVVGNAVYGQTFDYAGAGASLYGTGCGGAPVFSAPLAGDEFYSTGITALPANAPAALLLSAAPAATNLASIGMQGCFLNVSTVSYVALNTAANAAGQATLALPLPDAPVAVVGDVYSQWIWLAPGANTLGVLASQGIKHSIH